MIHKVSSSRYGVIVPHCRPNAKRKKKKKRGPVWSGQEEPETLEFVTLGKVATSLEAQFPDLQNWG